MQIPRFITLSMAAISLLTLSSCVTYDDGYGRDDYGYRDPGYNNSGYGNRSYGNRGYGYGSVGRSVCRSCNYDPCRCRGGYDHNDRYQRGYRHPNQYDDRREGTSTFKRPSNEYRIAGGSVGSKTKPEGYHTIDWYRARGYDTSRLTLKNENGDTYRRSTGSSSSRSSASSSRSSSGSSASRSSSGGSSSSSKKSSSSGSSKKSSGSSSKKSSNGITGGAAGTGRGAGR